MKYLFELLLVGLTNVLHAQAETSKQLNCNEVKGFQTADYDLVPDNYTGIAFTCENDKVTRIKTYKNGI